MLRVSNINASANERNNFTLTTSSNAIPNEVRQAAGLAKKLKGVLREICCMQDDDLFMLELFGILNI